MEPTGSFRNENDSVLSLEQDRANSRSISRTIPTSNQQLLAGLTPNHRGLGNVVHSQSIEEPDASISNILTHDNAKQVLHSFICERCSGCKCQECCRPRRRPSCRACGQYCPYTAETIVEYVTCLRCVKCLFYHCSAQDNEENCADQPCSCAPDHACARWSTMALLALCLPCLCCYPPAKLCLVHCQSAHDQATQPGCRCSNTNTVC